MNKPANPSLFTSQEIQAAIKNERLFYHLDADPAYPFIVFVTTPKVRWEVADAWHINANGMIKPDELTPVPVRYIDALPLELELGKPALKVARPIKPTRALGPATQRPAGTPVAAKARTIDADVLAVLERASAEDQLIRLGPERLDRALYARVNDVLVALGGKWVGGKTQAHKFTEEAAPILETALATGSYTKPQDFGFFPTPPALVKRVLNMVTIEPGMKMLEPHGGTGAFAVPMAEAGADMGSVTTYELLPKNVQVLRDAGLTDVREGDFLQATPEPVYDLVVMNPPFADGADIAHLMHAARFLKPTGKLVAITSPSWSHNTTKKSPPRQNSCRPDRTKNLGAAMKDDSGSIRTIIQRQSGSQIATTGERLIGGGLARGWCGSGNAGAMARGCPDQARPRAGLVCGRPA